MLGTVGYRVQGEQNLHSIVHRASAEVLRMLVFHVLDDLRVALTGLQLLRLKSAIFLWDVDLMND